MFINAVFPPFVSHHDDRSKTNQRGRLTRFDRINKSRVGYGGKGKKKKRKEKEQTLNKHLRLDNGDEQLMPTYSWCAGAELHLEKICRIWLYCTLCVSVSEWVCVCGAHDRTKWKKNNKNRVIFSFIKSCLSAKKKKKKEGLQLVIVHLLCAPKWLVVSFSNYITPLL